MTYSTDDSIHFFTELLSCCYPLYVWKYDADHRLMESNCPKKNTLDGIFAASGCKACLWEYARTNTLPILLNESLGLMWAGVPERTEGKLTFIHVIGPVFTNETALPSLKKALRDKGLSVILTRNTEKFLESVPVISSMDFFRYTIMFYYCITGVKISVDQICLQSSAPAQDYVPDFEEEESEGKNQHLGVYSAETLLMRMVREGNLNYSGVLNTAAIVSSGVKMKHGNTVRQAKNSVLLFIALCSRAAIDGGLAPEVSYSLCDLYTELVEDCSHITDLMALSRKMYHDFVERVHRIKQNTALSKPIQLCCDHIVMHICDDLSIRSLARLCGYSEYYLSRKFKQETGISIKDYINRHRIEYAKSRLAASRDSVQDISDSLHYSSRSYFSSLFQKMTGMSPSEYRDQYSVY